MLFPLVLGLVSCGGGPSGSLQPPPPPPPAADFILSAESPTVTAQQGGAPQYQLLQASALNGFTGTINLTVSGLPAGVTTLQTVQGGPLSIQVTANGGLQASSFQLIASSAAVLGTSTVTVTGTSGSITHTAPFSLAVTQGAPFAIQVSPPSLSLTPVSQRSGQVSITAAGGNATQFQLNIAGPQVAGINVTIQPTVLTPTNPVSFVIDASLTAQALQNFPVVVTASDNNNNTSSVILPLTVTVPFATNTTPTRSTFSRTDQSVTGMVYDEGRKLLFVSVEILNEVEVLSTIDGHKVASIPTNYPAGIDEAADGSAVYVVSPYFGGVTIIDPDLYQVVGHANVPQSVSGLSQVTFFEVAGLSNGKVLLYPSADDVDLTKPPFYLWDPQANSFSLFGPANSASSVGLISRSADHSKVLAYAGNGATGGMLYDATTNTFTGPTPIINAISAVSPNGSQIVSAGYQNSTPVLIFYDSNLNVLGSLPLNDLAPIVSSLQPLYSEDGTRLYLIPNQGIGVASGSGAVGAVIDTTSLTVVGLVPCFSFGAILPFSGQWIATFATDETGMLFGAGFDGVGFLDMSAPTLLKEPTPVNFLVQPSLASLSGATAVQLNGVGFDSDSTFNFFIGAPPSSTASIKASGVSVQSQNVINATIPSGKIAGAANATLTRSDGFFEVIPDAVTFGPTILQVDADAGSTSGGDSINIVGYGLSGANTQVTIGGKPATISQTTGATVYQAFPNNTMTLTTPPGAPGMADVVVNTPSGTTTIAGGFQYLSAVQVHPIAGALDAISYDRTRQRLYTSNQDHNRVEIFDLGSNAFLSPIPAGNAPTSITITPDGLLLAVLNSGDGTVTVIDPAKQQVNATYAVLTAADQACGGVATQISAAVTHRVFVSVDCTSSEDAGLTHTLSLDTGSLSCVGIAGCGTNGTDMNLGLGAPAMASTRDGTKVFFTAGDVALLDLNANTLTTAEAGDYSDAAASDDGNTFAADFGTYDGQLSRISIMAYEPYANSGSQSFGNVVGEKLSPSGSLLFYPQTTGVDIFDVHTGRLVSHVVLPDPIPLDTSGMVLDETGTKMFLISSTGITIAELYQSPLSVGTVSPSAGTSGTTVTVRGSGFANGAVVLFGTTQVPATFVDSNTLQAAVPSLAAGPVRVTVMNADGRQYSLDDSFTVN
jgi:hypothetical protein